MLRTALLCPTFFIYYVFPTQMGSIVYSKDELLIWLSPCRRPSFLMTNIHMPTGRLLAISHLDVSGTESDTCYHTTLYISGQK